MKLLKDLWVLSNNHCNALESVPICFPSASWQPLTIQPWAACVPPGRSPAAPGRRMRCGLGIRLSSFQKTCTDLASLILPLGTFLKEEKLEH